MVKLASQEAELRIAQATVVLVCNHPFFATLLFRLRKRADPTAKTMWTDGIELGYNPSYVLSIGRDELVGVLAHEVLHVAGLHPWRRGSRDPGAWNVACDQVVNPIVTSAGLALPPGVIPGVPGKCAEELYVPPPPRDPAPQSQEPKDGSDSNSPPSPGEGFSAESGSDSGAEDYVGCGEVREPTQLDGSSLSEAERHQQMEEVKIAVHQAITAAQRAGNLPAGLDRFIAEAHESQVPWTEVLARFIDDQARHDYSWRRPNRRFAAAGIIVPCLWSHGLGRVAMGCDTSGSISEDALREVCGEILGAMTAYEERGQSPMLTVAWFDHEVYVQTIEDAEELSPQGGGGTSFRVVFDWLRDQDEQPRAIVMVTDGWCEDYGEDPEIPVLWVLTRKNSRFVPPFGEITYTLHT